MSDVPTLTEAQLKTRVVDYGPRNWDQLCQAFVRQVAAWTGGAPTPNYLSANAAYHDSDIVSKDASAAPAGAVHYWAIGTYGHVAVGLGGSRVLMASRYVGTFWGPSSRNVGVTTVSAYSKKTGATYRGWSRTNGHNRVLIGAPAAASTPRPAAGKKYTTARSGEGFIKIASRVGVSVSTLERLNPKLDGGGLKLGQRVYYA